MKRILVATDGSSSSTEAVAFAVELAADTDAELNFVHVVPVLDIVPGVDMGAVGAVYEHPVSEHDRTLLDEAATIATGQGVVATTTLLRGDTVDEIVTHADSEDVDLIVIGSRGHGAIASTLLGSVSHRVLSETKRPVLVVQAAEVAVPEGVAR